ncbi:MGMT family protein [Acidipropionibacterium virtanenii]|uniref:MGMT family protein n=1 Tax=Acidipropionibacterium virtanenii TaxID=2057246 RepID=UPI000DECD2C9|nr:MGMT family protein [Acidipropionibacterium virtanenii]
MDSEELIDRVLLVVDLIPAGRVTSYGDIAGIVGTSARIVGRVMSHHGHDVSWWRVVNASGRLPSELTTRARAHWIQEGIRLNADGTAVRMAVSRADLVVLDGRYREELDRAGTTVHETTEEGPGQ